jgi:lipopolysaccharide export system protein LptA
LLAEQGWAQNASQGTITLRADVQEANSITGVVTARGNVQIEYPTRSIYATSAQAQYFSQERRIILSGNVIVLQEANRLEAETVTYLIDEGRFVALPQPNQQVKTTYILTETESGGGGQSSTTGATGTTPSPSLLPPDASLDLPPLDAASTPSQP